MKLALMPALTACCVFAAGVAYSAQPTWEATKDKVLEFPSPEGFTLSSGKPGFDDSLLFLGRANESLAVALVEPRAGDKSLAKTVAGFAEAMLVPGLSCTKGKPGQGKLKNGWLAAWTSSTCKAQDGAASTTALVAFRAGDRVYLLSGVKVTSVAALDLAGKGRLRK